MMPLAHYGGAPEALAFLVPLALVVVLLRAGVKRRDEDERDDDVSS